MHVLVTRPTPQANATLEALNTLGHTCIENPLLTIEATGSPAPKGPFDGIIVTSANAIDQLSNAFLDKQTPVITTGNATASALQKEGFQYVHSVNGSAADIADNFLGWLKQFHVPTPARILYPCAKQVAHDLSKMIRMIDEKRTVVKPWIVYRANAAKHFSPPAQKALLKGEIDGVLLYSARTAKTFNTLFDDLHDPVPVPICYCLSSQISSALSDKFAGRIKIASHPTEIALLELL